MKRKNDSQLAKDVNLSSVLLYRYVRSLPAQVITRGVFLDIRQLLAVSTWLSRRLSKPTLLTMVAAITKSTCVWSCFWGYRVPLPVSIKSYHNDRYCDVWVLARILMKEQEVCLPMGNQQEWSCALK